MLDLFYHVATNGSAVNLMKPNLVRRRSKAECAASKAAAEEKDKADSDVEKRLIELQI